MKEPIKKTEVEIGLDEGDLYFEAGSEEAAYGFLALLLAAADGTMVFMETHVVEYEEVEMEKGTGLSANRTELIHLVTNLIEQSEISLIEDRDDASMLAIHIVDGLEDEADRQRMAALAISSDKTVPICPECGASQEDIVTFTAHEEIVTRCMACHHEAPVSEFRTAAAGDGESEED